MRLPRHFVPRSDKKKARFAMTLIVSTENIAGMNEWDCRSCYTPLQ